MFNKELSNAQQVFEHNLSTCEDRGDIKLFLSEDLDDMYIIGLNEYPL